MSKTGTPSGMEQGSDFPRKVESALSTPAERADRSEKASSPGAAAPFQSAGPQAPKSSSVQSKGSEAGAKSAALTFH